MDLIALEIPDVKLFRPSRFRDARGFFSEVHSSSGFSAWGINVDFRPGQLFGFERQFVDFTSRRRRPHRPSSLWCFREAYAMWRSTAAEDHRASVVM